MTRKKKSRRDVTSPQEIQRDASGKFLPGVSANPGGMPKQYKEVVELARNMCPEALQTLGEIMRDLDASASARVKACEVVLDRAYGRPTQKIGEDQEHPFSAGVEAAADRLIARLVAVVDSEPTTGSGQEAQPN